MCTLKGQMGHLVFAVTLLNFLWSWTARFTNKLNAISRAVHTHNSARVSRADEKQCSGHRVTSIVPSVTKRWAWAQHPKPLRKNVLNKAKTLEVFILCVQAFTQKLCWFLLSAVLRADKRYQVWNWKFPFSVAIFAFQSIINPLQRKT